VHDVRRRRCSAETVSNGASNDANSQNAIFTCRRRLGRPLRQLTFGTLPKLRNSLGLRGYDVESDLRCLILELYVYTVHWALAMRSMWLVDHSLQEFSRRKKQRDALLLVAIFFTNPATKRPVQGVLKDQFKMSE
jgi:hypothetical protein